MGEQLVFAFVPLPTLLCKMFGNQRFSMSTFQSVSMFTVQSVSMFTVQRVSMFTVQRVSMFTVQRVSMFTIQRIWMLQQKPLVLNKNFAFLPIAFSYLHRWPYTQ